MTADDRDSFVVIMAGGQGTRFWPESTATRPKQLLDLLGTGRSLLRMSWDRVAGVAAPGNILVVTSAAIAADVRKDLPDLPEGNLLVEPVGRNTAPCVGWAALRVRAARKDGVMAVLPADHFIQDERAFALVLGAALDRARRGGNIVTIGVRPHRAETGYGYIEGGEPVEGDILKARRFVEKPDRLTAEHYLEDGHFFWNAGIFVFTAERILADVRRFLPDIALGLDRIDEAVRAGDREDEARAVAEVYASIEGISIDYGIMEKEQSGAIEVLPASFGWSDLGSWGAVYERMPCDSSGNVARGGAVPVLVDAKGCLVSTTHRGKMIAICGIDHLAVIETEDAILVCPRNRDQDVRRVTALANEKRRK